MDKGLKKVAVVIPTYNESKNIEPLFDKLNEVQELIKSEFVLTAMIVDDNSPDGTAQVVSEEKQDRKFRVELIEREGKLGLGTAYICGLEKALDDEQDMIIQMDADLSHDPKIIAKMVEELKACDFVIGSRYIKGGKLPKWSLFRKLVSAGGNLYSRIILGFSIHDWTGGFNGYNAKVLKAIKLDEIKSNGYSFQIEMKYRAKSQGFTFKEVPIEFHDRTYGKSKFSKNIFFEALINTLKIRLGV